jgi:hypothetical protein
MVFLTLQLRQFLLHPVVQIVNLLTILNSLRLQDSLHKNRLVTFKDYETYILNNYPNIDSISVWGGEENEPPIYGKVLISMKPKENYYISEAEKRRIIDEIIKPKAIIAVQAEILDPEFLFILVDVEAQYDARKTTNTEAILKERIRNAIINYSNTFLNKFASKIIDSKLELLLIV